MGEVQPGHNIFGHARKLGVKMHFAKSARILLLVGEGGGGGARENASF